MIQILGLRKFIDKEGKEKTYDAFHKENWRAESLSELLTNIDSHLRDIPEGERWNMFYTIAKCHAEKRKFKSLEALAFDVDGIDKSKVEEYKAQFARFFNALHFSLIDSGNGLHFLIFLKAELNEKQIAEFKPQYNEICRKLSAILKEAGLPGKLDTTIFEPRRILRLPGTVNRKPDKPEVLAKILHLDTTPNEFSFESYSGMTRITKKDELDASIMRKYPKTDNAAILQGCKFLEHVKTNQDKVNEPQWYAALSILSRMGEDGPRLCHEYSKGHRGYSEEETNAKIEQALTSSGPRKCSNVRTLWNGCGGCGSQGKVLSPILIRDDSHIATEATGFHTISISDAGNVRFKPNYEDLRKYFEKEHSYLGLGKSKILLTFNGKFYEEYPDAYIEQYAQGHFDPAANNLMVSEFKGLVTRTNLRDPDWFLKSTKRKLNFQNGHLELETMRFKPHDPSVGFRYVLPYSYDPGAVAPRFSRMLEMVTGGDAQLKQVILEFLGYAISHDDCWAQKAMVFVGFGANGKSTLLNIIKALVGEMNYSSLPIDALSGSEYNRQLLDGKLINISEETPSKALIDASIFKTLVTGGEVQVRAPYKKPYFVRNRAKIIFSCNELPEVGDVSFGLFRRLIIVPFKKTFTKDSPDYDPHIEEKILVELPGIFNMVLNAYHDMVGRQGFTDSSAVKEEVENFRTETDSVRRWVKECLVLTNNWEEFRPLADMYTHYRAFCEGGGERAFTLRRFCKALRSYIPSFDARYGDKKLSTYRVAKGLRAVDFGEGLGADNVIPMFQ